MVGRTVAAPGFVLVTFSLPSEPGSIVIFLIVALVFLGSLWGVVSHSLALLKLVFDDPVTAMEAPAGEVVEVEGTVEPLKGHTLDAPLAGPGAVAYEFRVHRENQNTKGGRWREIESNAEAIPFLVRDESGVTCVAPDGAEINPAESGAAYLTKGDRPPEDVCRRISIPNDSLPWLSAGSTTELRDRAKFLNFEKGMFTESVKLEEESIVTGEEVHVRGPTKDVTDVPQTGDARVAIGVEDGDPHDDRLSIAENDMIVSAGGEWEAIRSKAGDVAWMVAFVIGSGVILYSALTHPG